MRGLMQSWPLTVDKIIDHAALWHAKREVVSCSADGILERVDYADVNARARKLSAGLAALGVSAGDRVATIAWNSAAHLEAWYAIMGIGAVCHTLNPRLFVDQLCYIINDAGDRTIITDAQFLPLLESIRDRIPAVQQFIVLGNGTGDVSAEVIGSEALIAAGHTDVTWGEFEENCACGLCYTSGTTGHPKGVLYSHRSNTLHSLMVLQADVFGLSAHDVVMPVVPMFHANAWGLTFAAPSVGAKLVMPGARLDGYSLAELIDAEEVTFAAAVPTVWQSLLDYLEKNGRKVSSLQRVVVGGSACSERLIRQFRDKHGVDVLHAWGMTELSPLGTISSMPPSLAKSTFDEQMPYRLKQGRPPFGVELQVAPLSPTDVLDSSRSGRLLARGLAVANSYIGSDGDEVDAAGWFDTGDIATIDTHGFVEITDRAKDLVKSGGEWISSLGIEQAVSGHPAVERVAVIGVPHPKWGERPLLLVQAKSGTAVTAEELREFLDGRIARWWVPDEIRFLSQLPLGATGKIDKNKLRSQIADETSSLA